VVAWTSPISYGRNSGNEPPTGRRRELLELDMSNRTYRLTEIVGTSPESVDQAIENGIARAAATLRHIDWFEVTDIRGYVRDDSVNHYQVTMKIGFRLEDE
jgi:flavin-binding protein dodecin